MRLDILTIFPEMFKSPFAESIVKRAIDSGAIELFVHDLRDWAEDKHKSVDDRPYGGGAGMVMKVDVIDRAIGDIQTKAGKSDVRKILMSAKGKVFDQEKAKELSGLDRLILVAGHYEGVDERVAANLMDEEIRIGDYVLTGGELPAMVLVDVVVRLLPGVLGNEDSAKEESHSEPGYLEHPQYTRPEEYKGWKVPEVLLSGDHRAIDNWKRMTALETSSSESVEITGLEQEHVAECVQIAKRAIVGNFEFESRDMKKMKPILVDEVKDIKRRLKLSVESGAGDHLVAVFKDQVVGLVGIRKPGETLERVIKDSNLDLKPDAELCSFYVDLKMQGKGIGKKLLNEFVLLVKKNGYKRYGFYCGYEKTIPWYEKNIGMPEVCIEDFFHDGNRCCVWYVDLMRAKV